MNGVKGIGGETENIHAKFIVSIKDRQCTLCGW